MMYSKGNLLYKKKTRVYGHPWSNFYEFQGDKRWRLRPSAMSHSAISLFMEGKLTGQCWYSTMFEENGELMRICTFDNRSISLLLSPTGLYNPNWFTQSKLVHTIQSLCSFTLLGSSADKPVDLKHNCPQIFHYFLSFSSFCSCLFFRACPLLSCQYFWHFSDLIYMDNYITRKHIQVSVGNNHYDLFYGVNKVPNVLVSSMQLSDWLDTLFFNSLHKNDCSQMNSTHVCNCISNIVPQPTHNID